MRKLITSIALVVAAAAVSIIPPGTAVAAPATGFLRSFASGVIGPGAA